MTVSLSEAAEPSLGINRSHTLEQFFSQERGALRKYIVTMSPLGSALGERAHTSKLAFVVHPDTLTHFGAETLQELQDAIFAAVEQHEEKLPWRFKNFKENSVWEPDLNKAVPSLNEGYEIIPPKEWSKQEKAVLNALRRIDYQMRVCVQEVSGESDIRTLQKERQYAVGISETAEAWTDGTSRIVFNRKLLAESSLGIGGFMKITSVMLHEYLHADSSTGTHIHEETFYQRHHDAYVHTVVGHLVFPAYRRYIQYLANFKVTPTKKLTEHLTLVENILASEGGNQVQLSLLAA